MATTHLRAGVAEGIGWHFKSCVGFSGQYALCSKTDKSHSCPEIDFNGFL